jgi:GNAT superfamily N-acetyltransferase
MSTPSQGRLRTATPADGPRLLGLWALVFDGEDAVAAMAWQEKAHAWFLRAVEDPSAAHFPVIEVDRVLVGTAIGTLETGVPNPYCPHGRVVRLANVVTVPEHRGQGHATRLVADVVAWARSIDADRVDLSATPDGQRVYEALGFELSRAPRMKLAL